MKRLYVVILLVVASFFLLFPTKEKGIIFKNILEPNTTYMLSMNNHSVSKVSFLATPDILKKLKERGVQNPMTVKSHLKLLEQLKTGGMKKDSTFTVKMKVDSASNDEVINGITKNGNMNSMFEGMRMTGYYTRKNTIDSIRIYDDSLPTDIKKGVSAFVTRMMDKIKYPHKPLGIGDSFKEVLPMQMNLPNGTRMKLKTIMKFTLMRVEANKAYFQTKSEVELDQDYPNISVELSGGGKGELIHDLKKNYMIEKKSRMTMSIRVDMGRIVMLNKMTTNSLYKVNWR